MIRYYVCGLGYDKNNCIFDGEINFGDFDTYEEAYEAFVKLQCKDVHWFFEGAPKWHQMLLQLEECEETDDESVNASEDIENTETAENQVAENEENTADEVAVTVEE